MLELDATDIPTTARICDWGSCCAHDSKEAGQTKQTDLTEAFAAPELMPPRLDPPTTLSDMYATALSGLPFFVVASIVAFTLPACFIRFSVGKILAYLLPHVVHEEKQGVDWVKLNVGAASLVFCSCFALGF